MPHSKQRLEQLKQQFPFLRKIHEWTDNPKLVVNVRVQRADHSLMFFVGEYHDGNLSSIGRTDKPDLVGRTDDMVWAIGSEDEGYPLLKTVVWRQRGDIDFLGEGLFTGHRAANPDDVSHIMLIRVIDWHRRNDSDTAIQTDTWKGEFVNRELEITVYQPPKIGFAQLIAEADLAHNVELRSYAMLRLSLRRPEVRAIADSLNELAKRFEKWVYSFGLGKMMDDSEWRGHSGTFNGVRLISFETAGRRMFTLQEGNHSITFICSAEPYENGSVGMGNQGIGAAFDKAIELVERVIDGWHNLDEPQDTMKPEGAITIT